MIKDNLITFVKLITLTNALIINIF